MALARPGSMQPSWKDADLDFFTLGRFISRKFCESCDTGLDGCSSVRIMTHTCVVGRIAAENLMSTKGMKYYCPRIKSRPDFCEPLPPSSELVEPVRDDSRTHRLTQIGMYKAQQEPPGKPRT